MVSDKRKKGCPNESCEMHKKKVKVGAEKAGKAVVAVVAPIVLGVVGKVIKDGQKEAINAGVKTVESVAKAVLKK